MVKTLQDCIVREKIISDDCRIKKFTVEKFKAKGDIKDPEGSIVEILPYYDKKSNPN